MDIIAICSINFYEKHFLIFFYLFLVLLHLWEAGGQLIDINVHWQIQFTFYFLWDFISLFFTQTSSLSIFVYLFSHTFLHPCNLYNYKKQFFNKLKAKSLVPIFLYILKKCWPLFYICCLLYLYSLLKCSTYFQCSIFLNTFLNIMQRYFYVLLILMIHVNADKACLLKHSPSYFYVSHKLFCCLFFCN